MTADQDDSTPEERDDLLAAEYVLGVLNAKSRATVTQLIQADRAFAARVAFWEARLEGLNEGYGEVEPSSRVKRRIDATLFGAPRPSAFARLFGSVHLWRAAFAAAAIALGVFLLAERPAPNLRVAALVSAETGQNFLAAFDPAAQELRVALTAGEDTPARDFEVWLIVGEAAPVSLGLLDSDATAQTTLSAEIPEGALLAVSLEPVGGSTTGAPSGPVLAVGSFSAL
ncbi:MAG: anti-sigma factor [Pseudomonadota bacterium]